MSLGMPEAGTTAEPQGKLMEWKEALLRVWGGEIPRQPRLIIDGEPLKPDRSRKL